MDEWMDGLIGVLSSFVHVKMYHDEKLRVKAKISSFTHSEICLKI